MQGFCYKSRDVATKMHGFAIKDVATKMQGFAIKAEMWLIQ